MSYWCNECQAAISYDVYAYSKRIYGRPLCMKHQKQNKTSNPNTHHLSSVKEGTPATQEEDALYQALLDEGFEADEIILNKKADKKHVDISVPSARVNIEIDGLHHQTNPKQALADIKRTYYSFKKGWYTIRVPNALVRSENLLETARFLRKLIEESEDQLSDDY